MKRLLLALIIFIQATLFAGIPITHQFKGPTEQLIKRETWRSIDKNLSQMHIPKIHYPYFNKISKEEDWGHIGYHGANQGFRIYQDIIRYIVEEIVHIPIPPNFHFLRIPGDSDLDLNSINEFKNYWGLFDNRNTVRAKQLLSLNYGIYSNYTETGSCSLKLFVNNKEKEIDFSIQLEPLFTKLEIPLEAIDGLMKIAAKHLTGSTGILLQLVDRSHLGDKKGEAYNFADKHCYPSKKGGFRYDNALFSSHIQRIMSSLYVKKQVNISPQLRLLINNRFTLNPSSYLEIKRWDFYDAKTVQAYEYEMREYIKTLPHNSSKALSYQQQLLELWKL